MSCKCGEVPYSAGILDWSDQEVRAMDVKTRKGHSILEEKRCNCMNAIS